jgi:hypothetical protein
MNRAVLNVTGGVLIAASVAGLGYGFAWYLEHTQPVPLDEATLCPTDRPLAEHTVILVDQTDSLSPAQRQRLRALIDAEAARLAIYGKLTVLALDPDSPYEPQRLFSLCAPQSGRDVNGVTGNPSMAQRRWRERFGGPLNAALDRLLTVPAADISPIVEAVKGVTWLHDFRAEVPNRRLVIFSDMLQNTAAWSHYRDGVQYARFARTPFALEQHAALSGVVVVIDYLERPSTLHLQTAAHRRFWIEFFEDTGAVAEIGPDVPGRPEPPAVTITSGTVAELLPSGSKD